MHFAASGKVCDLLFAGGFTEINALDKQNQSALHTARNASVAKAILEHPNFNQLNVTWKFSQLWDVLQIAEETGDRCSLSSQSCTAWDVETTAILVVFYPLQQ